MFGFTGKIVFLSLYSLPNQQNTIDVQMQFGETGEEYDSNFRQLPVSCLDEQHAAK